MNPPEDPEGKDAAIEAIKKIHASKGYVPGFNWFTEFIRRTPWLGVPARLPRRGKRGPTPSRTQYDRHAEWQEKIAYGMSRWYHMHFVLPSKGAAARRRIGESSRKRIQAVVEQNPAASAHEICQELKRKGDPVPDESTVRRILRERKRT